MHESSLMRGLVARAEGIARAEGATRVTAVDVWLGALSQMSAAHFRGHFAEATAGTALEGARLAIETSDDPMHPESQHIVLRSVEVDG